MDLLQIKLFFPQVLAINSVEISQSTDNMIVRDAKLHTVQR